MFCSIFEADLLVSFFLALDECFKGAEIGLGGGSGLNDFFIYRARHNIKHCIASKPIKFLFDGKGVRLNDQGRS